MVERKWWTVGQITEERVCHNNSPLAKWRVPIQWGVGALQMHYDALVAEVKSLDRRAFMLNRTFILFADLDAAMLFWMKHGK